MRTLGLFLVFACFCDAALAVTRRVPSEYPNIQTAIDASAEGDTVLVAPGTYVGEQNRDLDFHGTNLVLKSEAGSAATILHCLRDGRGLLFQNGEDSSSRVEGFTIRSGSSGWNDGGGGIKCAGTSPTLMDLVIEECRATNYGGGMYCYDGSPLLDGVSFLNNQSNHYAEIAWSFGGGFYCHTSSPTIRNCFFINNGAYIAGGWWWGSVALGGAIYSSGGAPKIENVVFSQNSVDAGPLGTEDGAAIYATGSPHLRWTTVYGHNGATVLHFEGGATVENSIVAFNSHGVYGDALITCSDFYANGGGGDPGGSNFSADPLFCGAGGGDFYLSALSPCLPANNDCGVLVGVFGADCYGEYTPLDVTATMDLFDRIDLSWGWFWTVHSGFQIERDGEIVYTGTDPDERTWSDMNCEIGWHGYTVRAILPDGPGRAGFDWGRRQGELLAWIHPAGGEFVRPGEWLRFFWEETYPHPTHVDIELSRSGPDGPWEMLLESAHNYGSAIREMAGPGSTDCYLRISDSDDGDPSVTTDAPFTISHRTWRVPQDYPSIQEAIDASIVGDTVLVAPGLYQEQGLVLGFGMTLVGDGGERANVIIDAGEMGRILTVADVEEEVLVRNLTFQNGLAIDGGAILCVGSTIRIESCAFEDNNVSVDGGAIHAIGSTLNLNDCSFRDNYAEEMGGGLFAGGASIVSLQSCDFEMNRATIHGGGILAEDCDSVELIGCIFRENSVDIMGAGVFVMGSPVSVQESIFEGNQADDSGGGIYCNDWATGSITSCLFSSNMVGRNGAGIACTSSPVAVSHCLFFDNIAGNGGGLFSEGQQSATLTSCTFSRNSSIWDGGGTIAAGASTHMSVEATIIAFSLFGKAVDSYGYPTFPHFTCSDIYGNAGGDWTDLIADQAEENGNFSLDPLFCDAEAGDLRLQPGSPCLAGNNDCGDQIGGQGEGCDDTPVFLSSFYAEPGLGRVKLHWETSEPMAAEFELMGSIDDTSWLVDYGEPSLGIYRATDESVQLASGGAVTYTLSGREPGEDWQLLRTITVEVEALAFPTRLLAAHPNPFNPQVTVPFTLREKGRVQLTVYDIAGRRVARLADAVFPPGRHELVWEGRDDAGHTQSSGIYLIRMTTAGFQDSQRLVLLR